jgi:pilus assembly protein CpaE
MQLFGNKKDLNESKDSSQEFVVGRISGFQVAILSKRSELIEKIRSVLFLYNVLGMEVIPLELSELKEDPCWSNYDVVILDIKDEDDAELLSENVNRCIPIQASTILIGSHDSIQFSEFLLKKGIHFLLESSQLEKIISILNLRSVTPPGSSQRVGSVVTFLGCKGGIGTSSLVVHVLKNISKLTNYPILYIQGATTSSNADFLFEMPIPQDGSLTNVESGLQVKVENSDSAWKYDELNSGQFNITFIDQNMGLSSSIRHLDDIITISNIIFIVINRDPYSIKVAKKILEEISRSTVKKAEFLNKRFLICLNDNTVYDKKNALRDEDIEEFLERSIDFKRKYIAKISNFKKAANSGEIKEISSAIIGNKKAQKDKSKKSFSILKRKTDS